MLANANSRLDDVPRNPPSAEVVALCVKHGLHCGVADDLAAFLLALDRNKLLAMEFWSLVARHSDLPVAAPGGPSGDRDLLATIVETVAGQTVPEATAPGSPNRPLVKTLAGLLAGEDLSAPPIAAPPLRDLPGRLEPGRGPAAEPDPPLDAAVAAVAGPVPLPQPNKGHRLVLASETPFADATSRSRTDREAPTEADPILTIPLASYAEEDTLSRRSPWPIAGAFILALTCLGVWWFAHQRNAPGMAQLAAPIRTGYDSSVAAIKGLFGSHSAPAPAADAQTPSTAAPAPQSSAGMQPGPAPQPSASTQTSAASQPDTAPPAPSQSQLDASSTGITPARAAPPQPPTAPRASRSAAPTEVRHPSPDAQEPVTVPAAAGDIPDDLPVVPEAVMKRNLISSRFPISTATQGIVVLRAVISAGGAVERLSLIKGDPSLVRAAMDAAYTWTYRPYLINGAPVAVSTTITIDFSGND